MSAPVSIGKLLAPSFLVLVAVVCSGCKPEVGVEWVVDYSAVGKPTVPGRQSCAEGFYNAVLAHPDWVGTFNRGDANAWERDFKHQSASAQRRDSVDSVDFAYFAGHGAGAGFVPTGVGRGGGFTFGVNANDDWVLAAIPTNREPRWGDGDLDWIVLDVCSALALKSDGDGVLYTLWERWGNSDVMHGLHMILGFRTYATDSWHRGEIFAEYLTGAANGTKYRIRDAWRRAVEDTEYGPVQGAILGALGPGSDTRGDYLHKCGSVADDPDPATQSYWYSYWPH